MIEPPDDGIPPRPSRNDWPRRNGRPQIEWHGETLDCYSPSKLSTYLGAGFAGNPDWRARHIAKGAGIRPDLAIMAAPLHPQTDRDELNTIAQALAEAGGIMAAANRGTAAHSLLRRLTRRQLPDIPDELTDWATAIVNVLTEWGIQLAWDDSDELFVVDPSLPAAGECDAYVTTGDPRLPAVYSLDLKTGQYKPFDCAIQLACYANATHVGTLTDGQIGLTEIPRLSELSTEYGLVLHAPLDGTPPTIRTVDLTEAYSLATTCIQNHRLTLNSGRFNVDPEDITPTRHLQPVRDSPLPVVQPITTPLVKRIGALTGRLTRLVDETDCTKTDVAEAWPDGTPFLTQPGHTDDTLSLIEGAVILLETVYGDTMNDLQQAQHRLAHLPDDILETVRQQKNTVGIPQLTQASRRDFARLAPILDRAEYDANTRLTKLVDALNGHPEADADEWVAWATETSDTPAELADADGLATLTATEAERVIALANAAHLTGEDLADAILARYVTKTAAVNNAKLIAGRHQLIRPRKWADLVGDRILATLTYNHK